MRYFLLFTLIVASLRSTGAVAQMPDASRTEYIGLCQPGPAGTKSTVIQRCKFAIASAVRVKRPADPKDGWNRKLFGKLSIFFSVAGVLLSFGAFAHFLILPCIIAGIVLGSFAQRDRLNGWGLAGLIIGSAFIIIKLIAVMNALSGLSFG